MLVDSATNLWFPMSAELSELLSSPVTHSYLAGLPIPHNSCSHHTLPSFPTFTLTPLNLNTWFLLLQLRTLRLSGMNSLHFLPLHLQIYLYLHIETSFCVSKNPYSSVHWLFWFHSSPLPTSCFINVLSLFCSVSNFLWIYKPTWISHFVKKICSHLFYHQIDVSFSFLKRSWQCTLHSMVLIT